MFCNTKPGYFRVVGAISASSCQKARLCDALRAKPLPHTGSFGYRAAEPTKQSPTALGTGIGSVSRRRVFQLLDLGMRSRGQTASDYKRQDAASYDDAAAEFDRLTERFSGPLAMRILDLARLRPTDQVLDVGTGTGLVALRAAALAQNGRVFGIDHSAGMLEQASAKARRSGLSDAVAFRQMDAEQLEFPDRSFNAALSLYALFHFPDPLAAVREMHRVLRPGGRVVIGVGSRPSLFSWNGIVQGTRAAPERVAAASGRLLTAPQFLLHLMCEHGMEPDVEHRPKGSRTRI